MYSFQVLYTLLAAKIKNINEAAKKYLLKALLFKRVDPTVFLNMNKITQVVFRMVIY